MKQSKIKVIPYGETSYERFHIRAQGHRVRLQDMESGLYWLFSPEMARLMCSALLYAAKHAETLRLTPEMRQLLERHGYHGKTE